MHMVFLIEWHVYINKNNNNQNYIAPYGRNFRGAGGGSAFLLSATIIIITLKNCKLNKQATARFDGKLQISHESRTFKILHAKNHEHWFRFLQVTEN